MPTAACRSKHSCLARRQPIFECDAIWVRDHECMGCIEGTARRMDGHVPERDSQPYRYERGICRCGECGIRIDRRNKGGCCVSCRADLFGDDGQRKKPAPERIPVPDRIAKPTRKKECREGHPYARYGHVTPGGRVICNVCAANRKRDLYRRKKLEASK